ncbi:MAG: glutamate--cysteine ligase [Deltaproteobacteria bacterium]|nr:glutamate--cysteine ligase [Deltaproteobacteria bacterium]MBW2415317.1 glutamate--cysteine ligase [Deltaproteobacteria bacterium]
MGLQIDRDQFDDAEYAFFAARLEECLQALREMLQTPGFGAGPPTLGAELELSLIDAAGRPLPQNLAVLRETMDPRLTVELDRFNLECNLRYAPLEGRPFTALANEMHDALAEVRRAARTRDADVALIGILPTLRASDLQGEAMTDTPRFRALSAALARLRHEPFLVDIDGQDPLEITTDHVTFEGANTSLQIHLRVPPDEFARTYNAIQLATAPALAAAGNSPTFLGHRLWEETRVALFKQSIDVRRSSERLGGGREARVSFGSGWVRESAFELFADNVKLHEPLLPVLSDELPLDCLRSGRLPRLEELRLHQGTVWCWNRGIYDPDESGHLRIEMRALPAGPTVADMVASTAFLVGLGLGLAAEADALIPSFPFERAHHSFYRAAQQGLDARLFWPPEPGAEPVEVDARELIERLLPCARRGLDMAGVDPDESAPLLDCVAERTQRHRTGARWQRLLLNALLESRDRDDALATMFRLYREASEGGEPVSRWPEPTSLA